MDIKFFADTDTGKKYSHNEDFYILPECRHKDEPSLFILCDGIGGANAGEVASKLTAQLLNDCFLSFLSEKNNDEQLHLCRNSRILQESITQMIREVSDRICEIAKENHHYLGMGTTIVTALFNFSCNQVIIHSVGDSRCYRIRSNRIEQLTEDQSYVWDLFKSGAITKNQILEHPRNNVIKMAVGITEDLEINSYIYECRENDLYLLCTDGLTDMLYDHQIEKAIQSDTPLEVKGKQLIEMANNAGGKDNITLILISL